MLYDVDTTNPDEGNNCQIDTFGPNHNDGQNVEKSSQMKLAVVF